MCEDCIHNWSFQCWNLWFSHCLGLLLLQLLMRLISQNPLPPYQVNTRFVVLVVSVYLLHDLSLGFQHYRWPIVVEKLKVKRIYNFNSMLQFLIKFRFSKKFHVIVHIKFGTSHFSFGLAFSLPVSPGYRMALPACSNLGELFTVGRSSTWSFPILGYYSLVYEFVFVLKPLLTVGWLRLIVMICNALFLW